MNFFKTWWNKVTGKSLEFDYPKTIKFNLEPLDFMDGKGNYRDIANTKNCTIAGKLKAIYPELPLSMVLQEEVWYINPDISTVKYTFSNKNGHLSNLQELLDLVKIEKELPAEQTIIKLTRV